MAKVFITGGTGCIGAVAVYQLITQYGDEIEQVLIGSRSSSTDQLEIWFGESLQQYVNEGKIAFAQVDIGDQQSLQGTLETFKPTHVIHLGALQSPDCASDPAKGLAVNLAGTMSLFNMIEALDPPLKRMVFASSGAVYGKRAMYPEATVSENAQLSPPNLYGVWKVAGEHLATLFHENTGIPTVSLRLNTTFGPGRDQGTTSAPTKVMKSLVLGANEGESMPFEMPYRGRENYHYVEDVGAHFAGVCMLPFEGCQAFNIKGKTIEVSQFLEMVKAIAVELGIDEFLETGIAADATPNLFICDLDDAAVEAQFPGLPRTPIDEGIRKTIERFRVMVTAGRVKI
ncbi:MAG: NAD(P)-dependent oxidoreductase [Mariniblastus sp.]|nr:NAD(P)-dependent oxidoreductase [Mariniblastus sp.]